MQNHIDTLIETIKTDYWKFMSRNGTRDLPDHSLAMIDRFNAGIKIKEGNKYIKILTGSSVWGLLLIVTMIRNLSKVICLKQQDIMRRLVIQHVATL